MKQMSRGTKFWLLEPPSEQKAHRLIYFTSTLWVISRGFNCFLAILIVNTPSLIEASVRARA